MALKFYTNPMSRGRIVRWMLEEVGEPYETEVLDFATTAKSSAFLAINPMGKVPTIVHNGQIVTECAAICAYLAAAFPEKKLGPTDAERADYLRWMFFAAGPVEQAITNRSLGCDPPADKAGMVGYGSYDLTVGTLERAVSAHDYIAGDRFTAADVYVGSQVLWGTQFKTLPARDAFTAYGARLSTRAAYRRASELDDALMPKQEG